MDDPAGLGRYCCARWLRTRHRPDATQDDCPAEGKRRQDQAMPALDIKGYPCLEYECLCVD